MTILFLTFYSYYAKKILSLVYILFKFYIKIIIFYFIFALRTCSTKESHTNLQNLLYYKRDNSNIFMPCNST